MAARGVERKAQARLHRQMIALSRLGGPNQETPVTTYTSFTKETFAAFRENNRTRAIDILNLIRHRDQVDYPNGREASGLEAGSN